MKQIAAIGLDLGKSVFYVHAVNRKGKVVERKRLTRAGLRRFILRVSPCLVEMEACGGSQHWARWLNQYGHEAKLMPAQYVKGVREDEQERLARCRSDRGVGAAPDDALCVGEDGGTARAADAAPHPQSGGG